MNSTHIISQDVFDKIRSRFQNLEMGDEDGGVTLDPKLARFFDFDFIVEGKNLGRVSISINERGTLKVFYSQGILEDTNDFVKDLWYDFLREMRMFAKRRLLRFDTRDITKSNLNKNDFQYLATNGPKDDNMDLNESAKFEGSKKTSYRVLEKTKLIAKHKKSIETEEHGARSRGSNIKALYIENAEGERYKYPFIHIAGAKAMQRHVANGGRPYDEKGQAIVKISEEILQLSAFKRHVGKPDGMNQRVNEITSKTNEKLMSLRRTVEGLCNQSYYEKWSENFVPNAAEVQLDEVSVEDYKSAFTVSSFREDLMQYFPLIHKVMNEAGELDLEEYVATEGSIGSGIGKVAGGIGGGIIAARTKQNPIVGAEIGSDIGSAVGDKVGDMVSSLFNKKDKPASEAFDDFTEWADRVEEGKLEPDTLADLKDLLDNKLTLDVGGQSAIDGLEGIGVNDEELFAQLRDLADPEKGGDPKNDPKDTVVKWLSSFDPEAAEELFGSKSGSEPADDLDMAKDIEQDSDEMPKEEMNTSSSSHIRKIAEKIYSHYNRHHKEQGLGPFPKGEKGIYDEVTNDFGEEAGELAAQLIKELGGDISSIKENTTPNTSIAEGTAPSMASLDAVFNEHDFYRLEHIWPALDAGDKKEALRQINHYLTKGKNRAWWGDLQAIDIDIDPNDVENSQVQWSKPIQKDMEEASLEYNTPDPVVTVQNKSGEILDKVNLSVAAQKYQLGHPDAIKKQLAHQNYTDINNYTIAAPIGGQPQDNTTQAQGEDELSKVLKFAGLQK